MREKKVQMRVRGGDVVTVKRGEGEGLLWEWKWEIKI